MARMKALTALLLVLPASASAMAVGRQTCADAAVVGGITGQTYERIANDDTLYLHRHPGGDWWIADCADR